MLGRGSLYDLTLSHSDSLIATAYESLTAREITLHNIFTCKKRKEKSFTITCQSCDLWKVAANSYQ